MFDGIKILCKGTKPQDWEHNPLLKFATKIDTTTGEFLANSRVAFYRGLSFHLIPSTISTETHCIIKGSLAVYYNKGGNNAFDYDITMIEFTLHELANKFKVNIETAEIQAVEFGINLTPEQPIKQIINGLRAYQSTTFTGLKMDNVFNGKQLVRQEYAVKIYDKGLQTQSPETNTIRIEYAIKSTKTARKHGVCVLKDLLSPFVIESLKVALLGVWENVIFYDKGMKWRYMNDHQQKKMLYYLDATNWIKFSKMQRLRAKKEFKSLTEQFCSSTTHAEITNLLTQKIDQLKAIKCYHLRNFSPHIGSHTTPPEMLPFTHLDKGVNSNQNHSKNREQTSIKKQEKKRAKIHQKECAVCCSKIEHKRADSLYCSKRCNNSFQAKKRKEVRRENKKSETQNLTVVLSNLKKTNLSLLIEYKADGIEYADQLDQNEIKAPDMWIRSVYKVSIDKRPCEIVLTSYRARKLIKEISKASKIKTVQKK